MGLKFKEVESILQGEDDCDLAESTKEMWIKWEVLEMHLAMRNCSRRDWRTGGFEIGAPEVMVRVEGGQRPACANDEGFRRPYVISSRECTARRLGTADHDEGKADLVESGKPVTGRMSHALEGLCRTNAGCSRRLYSRFGLASQDGSASGTYPPCPRCA